MNLTKVVDSMIEKKMTFNEELSEKLYEKFFSAEKELKTIVETGATFQKELKKIVSVLKETGEDTSLHTNTLMEQMSKLSDFEGANELKDIVKVIIDDTDKMQAQSQKLESKLEENTFKIESLQSNLENARIESRTDALTNIGNRKFFEEKIEEYVTNHKKLGHDLCLILCDIDFFKKFNDNFGHQIGDQVLKVVAHVIKKELGLQGSAARYGGEEFAILLPKAKLGDAIELADHIRKVISERIIKNKNTGANFGRITMSFGVASMNANMTADDLTQKSDSALYLSKENGRNMVQSELELDQVVDGKQSA
ncbi:MAG: GGDEF domain-containing protein [Emcibacteraceae bacterium]|nr:GGDEF domain-containing protein [Emcibacteraceae bacterium]MDG1727279.1 GGDEF domain-containing protein [Emcibacteraceae bacterium]